MSIGTPPNAQACCRDCKKPFETAHGALVHYGQNHGQKTAVCVTCEEEFTGRHVEQKKQCLDCLKKHGPLNQKI